MSAAVIGTDAMGTTGSFGPTGLSGTFGFRGSIGANGWGRKSRRSAWLWRWILAAGSIVCLGATPAAATSLNLDLLQFPDVISGNIDVTYDATSDTLVMTGFALELDDDGIGTAEAISNGSFDLSASIDAAGALTSGTLTIGGTIANLGFNSGTLLTGTLNGFGFPNGGGDPLEFTFDVTGGDMAGLYGSGLAGIIVGDAGFGGSFASDFDNLISGTSGTGFGVSDVAPVPEPGTLALLAAALGGISWIGRDRHRESSKNAS